MRPFWRPRDHFGTLGERGNIRKDMWGTRIGLLNDFGLILTPHLKVVWAPRVRNPVLFTVSFPCHF